MLVYWSVKCRDKNQGMLVYWSVLCQTFKFIKSVFCETEFSTAAFLTSAESASNQPLEKLRQKDISTVNQKTKDSYYLVY